jgi:hypothetical protein
MVESATVKGSITAADANLAISVENTNVSGKILIEQDDLEA